MRYLIYQLLLIVFIVTVSLSCDEKPAPKVKTIISPKEFPKYTWVCYAPTHFDPTHQIFPNESEMREDLQVLRDYGFTGVITYGSDGSLWNIPRLAQEVCFDACIMGIFYFDDEIVLEEIENAIVVKEYVDAYCVGNEGLGERYTIEQLEEVMNQIVDETGRPVTTAEQIEDYLAGDEIADWLLTHGDWLFPIVHPVNNGIYDPTEGLTWTVEKYNQMIGIADSKLVFVKETGWPTDGASWASEENQRDYFQLLGETEVFFAYFEAFDQPWKTWQSWEPYWGLFDENRNPKLFTETNF